MDRESVPERSDVVISWNLVKSSLWLRGAFIAAAVAILGIIMLAGTEPNLLRSLAQIVAGGLGTVYALRRSWRLLDEGEAGPAPQKRTAPLPARVNDGSPSPSWRARVSWL